MNKFFFLGILFLVPLLCSPVFGQNEEQALREWKSHTKIANLIERAQTYSFFLFSHHFNKGIPNSYRTI